MRASIILAFVMINMQIQYFTTLLHCLKVQPESIKLFISL